VSTTLLPTVDCCSRYDPARVPQQVAHQAELARCQRHGSFVDDQATICLIEHATAARSRRTSARRARRPELAVFTGDSDRPQLGEQLHHPVASLVAQPDRMISTRKRLQARSPDPCRQCTPCGKRHGSVIGAVQHERFDIEPVQPVTRVGAIGQLQQPFGGDRVGSSALQSSECVALFGIGVRDEHVSQCARTGAPMCQHQFAQRFAQRRWRDVLAAGVRTVQHEPPHRIRVACRPGNCRRAARRHAEQRGDWQIDVANDAIEQVDLVVQIALTVECVAEPAARPVVTHDGRHLAETFEEATRLRLSPIPFEMPDPPRRTHEQRPATVHGVCNASAVAIA